MERIKLLKNFVDDLSIEELHQKFTDALDNNSKLKVDYLNIYSANLSYELVWFSEFMNSCDIILCDGKGIQLACSLLGKRVPYQIAFNRWLWQFFQFCEKKKYSVYLLGSHQNVVDSALSKIKEKGISIRVQGSHGYFNKEGFENEEVIKKINGFAPDFLLIGFGMPLQEDWVQKNHKNLSVPIVINGGAYLEWISESVKLPPRLVSRFGFEWLYRLLLEPRRLAHRYLVGIPKFFFRILFTPHQ